MTRPAKRALIGTDYRARSPKRRKFGTTTETANNSPAPSIPQPVYSTREITWEEQLTLPKRFHIEEGVWPARAILKERKRGVQLQYLVEWEPHPRTDEIFEPTWEPKKNLGDELIGHWEAGKKTKRTSDFSYEPSQALPQQPSSRPSTSSGLRKAPVKGRTKRTRPLIVDTSSELGSTLDPDAQTTSITPSLASTADSSAEDDYGPDSPSFEIEETQAQSSLPPTTVTPAFTLEIPVASFDKSGYESYQGSSQLYSSTKSPAKYQSSPASGRRTRSSSKQTSPQKTPLSQSLRLGNASLSARLSGAHRNLVEALDSADSGLQRIEIPASSEKKADADHSQAVSGNTPSSAPFIQESSAGTASKSVRVQFQADEAFQSTQDTPARFSKSFDIPAQSGSQPLFQSSVPLPLQRHTPASNESSREDPLLSSVQTSSPWQFESQEPQTRDQVVSPTAKSRRQAINSKSDGSKAAKMDLPAVRQSPRLQSATPVSRTRSPQRAQQMRRARTPQALGDSANTEAVTANMVTSPLATAPPHVADYTSPLRTQISMQSSHDEALSGNSGPQNSMYETPYGISALPIQQSIEEEPQSSADSIASKASSSQLSLQNERIIPQVDGVSLPTTPVTGPGEYLIGLPAEGKVQSIYNDNINQKRKLIVKFIHRRDSVGSANGSTSRTMERNEMIELMERLQDTTTHIDLGLPKFVTQYSIKSAEEAAYAEYAGSKFVFLGELVDMMKRVDCSLVIASKPGAVQDLIADYLQMKHVQVRRHDRPPSARAGTPEALRDTLKVDLVGTTDDIEGNLSAPPALIIAFDASFDNQAPHIKRIRELYSKGRDQPLPVIHLLVTNSAEHIDRCLRKAMPSPQRLKLLVRGTYHARANLGGSPSYVPRPSDEPEGRPMDMHDLQRAVRKSPNRKLQMMAAIVARAALSADFEENWTLNAMPEPQYDDLDETPPKSSGYTTTAGTAAPTPRDGRMRTRSPVSRSATPMGKKRMLDVDAASSLLYKRQRLTPMRDTTPVADHSRDSHKIDALHEQIKALTIDLATEKKTRLEAEEARDQAKQKLTETEETLQQWQSDHAALLRRYEKQRNHNRTLFHENKRVLEATENAKNQTDKVREINVKVRAENTQLKSDLAAARTDLTSGGGDIAVLESARSEARTATARVTILEKSLENTKRDFEFTRTQYQQASTRAAELVSQNEDLESQVAELKTQASDERRRLKEVNDAERAKRNRDEVERVTQENRELLVIVKKQEEENKVLKKGRGVQTRGSSAQPPGSPGMGGFGRRSRQASPAIGGGGRAEREVQRGADTLAVPGQGRDRVSAMRNEP